MKTQNSLEKIKHCPTNKEKLQMLVDNCPSGYLLYLKNAKKFEISDLAQWIVSSTPKLSDTIYTWQTKVYWILNNIVDFPKCCICGSPMVGCNVKSAQKGYADMLCSSTECHKKMRANRQKSTMLSNHGFSNNFQNPKTIEKIKQHNIELYGNPCPANNKEIRAKIEDDNVRKYGVKSYSSTQECKDKVKATNLKNLGVDNPFKSSICKEKTRQTMIERFGVDHPSKSQAIQDKKKQHLVDKYGENYKQMLWGNNHNIGQYRRSYSDFIMKSSKVSPMFSLDEFVEMRLAGKQDFRFKCKRCSKEFTSNWDNGGTRSCPHCMNSGCSNEEQELYTYLLSLVDDSELKHNDRTVLAPLELDFYFPKHKLAIEYDGLFWHSDEMQPDYKYHLSKTLGCEQKNIQLIHIFENEWIYKQDIVKSRIKNLLGIYDHTMFARKCTVVDVSSKLARDFYDKNHIQGRVNASINYGLEHDNEIVAMMSFGKSRFSKKYEWELLRFCTKLGCHVPGGASKLLKHFERSCCPASVVSYADRRWSTGNMYLKLGFVFDHASSPDYWYFNDYSTMVLKSRMQFQKHMLKSILPSFDDSKSEVENMRSNGYHRIFDCGNLVYVKTY